MRKAIAAIVCMIALIALAVVPAFAQDQSFDTGRITSGAANPSVKISNSGDFVNLCTPIQQVVNTGNVVNEQGVAQYGSESGDIDMEGSSIDVSPTFDSSCDQSISV